MEYPVSGVAGCAGRVALSLQLNLPIGELGTGIEGFPLYFQVAYRPSAGGHVLLAPAATAVLVDGAF